MQTSGHEYVPGNSGTLKERVGEVIENEVGIVNGRLAMERVSEVIDAWLSTRESQPATTQTATLQRAVRHLAGTWTTGRAVTLLYGAGYDVTEKRARQLLRGLAVDGLLEKTAPAIYRATEK